MSIALIEPPQALLRTTPGAEFVISDAAATNTAAVFDKKVEMTCIILCGGKSKRMGRPKEFLPLAGTTMLEQILDRANNLFAEVLLVTNKSDDFEHLSANIVKDIVAERGPLVGILSGLLVALHKEVFVLPSDMPLFDEIAIQHLLNYRQSINEHSGVQATIHANDEFNGSLPGIFNKSLIPALEEAVFSQRYSLPEFLATITHEVAFPTAVAPQGLPYHFDVNTPMDYIRLVHS